jgi:hypothetical protein
MLLGDAAGHDGGQFKDEAGAGVSYPLNHNAAPVLVDDLLTDRQP